MDNKGYNKATNIMEFFTRTETARYFKVDPRTVERWLRNGNLRGYKLGKGKTAPWRISKEDIGKFLEKSKI